MAKTIAITNQKGGVGKTTTAINLGAELAVDGKRVLLIDTDPQANATSGLGIARGSFRWNIYHCLVLEEPVRNAIILTGFNALSILPSDKNLAGAEIEMVEMERREFLLRRAIEPVQDDYEFIIVDCPPALGLLTINALVAADSVLIPIQTEYYALEGVTELFDTISRIRTILSPHLAVEGLVMTMYDERVNLSAAVAADLRTFYGDLVFEAVIPRNVRLAEAPSYGKPVAFYDPRSRGAESYRQLAKEVLARGKETVGQGPERTAVAAAIANHS
jgi:chromosome partitioning protein